MSIDTAQRATLIANVGLGIGALTLAAPRGFAVAILCEPPPRRAPLPSGKPPTTHASLASARGTKRTSIATACGKVWAKVSANKPSVESGHFAERAVAREYAGESTPSATHC
jgi:hypothetical protein